MVPKSVFYYTTRTIVFQPVRAVEQPKLLMQQRGQALVRDGRLRARQRGKRLGLEHRV